MKLLINRKLVLYICLASAAFSAPQLGAQYLTLEGQTGGFLTPTAAVVFSAPGEKFSHPVVGYHFIDASTVIGNIQTFSIAEGFANRAEAGYTRSVHSLGDSNLASAGAFSQLWNYSGMNIFSGKVVVFRDGQFGVWMPGVAVGGLVRTDDHFVSGHLNRELGIGPDKGYTNGDVYVVLTKTWLQRPVPFLLNFGWKATNASIFGIGGQATRFGGRLFGGIGIPLPFFFRTAIVPSAGFTQEQPQVKNLSDILVAPPTYMPPAPAHIPTTLDYAVRITQKDNPHVAFDVGVGQVASTIGTTLLPTGLPAPYNYAPVPVNLQARHVVGVGLSYRY
ncbi:MAG: hypothetical protein ACP5FH_08430 [Terracidiphilus sp.]